MYNINSLELNHAETYRPLWLFVFAAGKLGFSIPGAQTIDQHQCHNLIKSKHGLPCFVVFVFCSAKLSRIFAKQYYSSQNVAESELDILDAKSLEGQGALFVLWSLCQKRPSLLVYRCDCSNRVCYRWSLQVILRV